MSDKDRQRVSELAKKHYPRPKTKAPVSYADEIERMADFALSDAVRDHHLAARNREINAVLEELEGGLQKTQHEVENGMWKNSPQMNHYHGGRIDALDEAIATIRQRINPPKQGEGGGE